VVLTIETRSWTAETQVYGLFLLMAIQPLLPNLRCKPSRHHLEQLMLVIQARLMNESGWYLGNT